ncbi:hypothetical protein AYO44_10525 [Planctomycetaceae bacterium SCGC AG-212-F19]|nr:hypothetical protein AYO44_10525 [Planctomycetaceae bacterium SCGC AG-212-F19]
MNHGDLEALVFFLKKVHDLNCKVRSIDGDRDIDFNDMESGLKTFLSQISSMEWRKNHSGKMMTARRVAVERASSPGKRCPYGYDWQVLNREGQPVYKITDNGHHRYAGQHKVKRSGKIRDCVALHRTKLYPDGRTEEFNDTWIDTPEGRKKQRCFPALEKGYRKIEVINLKRAKVIQRIFALADGPTWLSPYEIQLTLEQEGIEHLGVTPWSNDGIKFLLRNPIYKGFPLYNRDRSRKTLAPRKWDEAFDYLYSSEQREAIRIIDIEQWNRVNENLNQLPANHKRRRRHNLAPLWARDFLICANCDGVLRVHSSRCPVYRCRKCGRVKAAVVEEIIDNWLRWLEESHNVELSKISIFPVDKHLDSLGINNDAGIYQSKPEDHFSTVPDGWVIETLKGGNGELITFHGDPNKESIVGLMHHEHRVFNCNETADKGGALWEYKAISHKMIDFLKTNNLDHLRWEHGLEEAYELTHKQVCKPITDQIIFIDKELDNLFKTSFSSDEMRKRCDLKAVELGAKKKELEGRCQSLLPEYRQAKARVIELAKVITQLRSDWHKKVGDDKRRLTATCLEKVLLRFTPQTSENVAMCKLMEITLYAKDGLLPPKTYSEAEIKAVIHKQNGRRNAGERVKQSPEIRRKIGEKTKARYANTV